MTTTNHIFVPATSKTNATEILENNGYPKPLPHLKNGGKIRKTKNNTYCVSLNGLPVKVQETLRKMAM